MCMERKLNLQSLCCQKCYTQLILGNSQIRGNVWQECDKRFDVGQI